MTSPASRVSTMNSPSGGNLNRRRPRMSWNYDENHHIRQYYESMPFHEQSLNAEHDDFDTDEADSEHGMEFCEPEGTNDATHDPGEDSNQRLPNTQYNYFASTSGRRRPRSKLLGKAWEIPSPAVMQRRTRFRQNIHDETRRHRRILPPVNSSSNNDRADPDGKPTVVTTTIDRPQNVLQLLRDREVFGGGSSNGGGIRRTNDGGNSSRSGFRTGVCIATAESDDDGSEERKSRRRRKKKRHRNAGVAAPSTPSHSSSGRETSGSKSPSSVTAASATASDETTANQPPWTYYHHNSHRPTTEELRTYAEQVSVTKFESSYLAHLQNESEEEEEELEDAAADEDSNSQNNNNDNTANDDANGGGASNSNANGTNSSSSNSNRQQSSNNNTSSKAVSTISIAFSPDGKTMASTHGDHTVKITCCMTGKLLQTLVGHPRTPWTVKYHPHAGLDHSNPNKKQVIIVNNSANSQNSNSNNSAPSRGGHAGSASREDSAQQQQHSQSPQHRQQIVASGCLGHQVRIWDWISGTCLQMIRLEFAIISLSFHPSGSVLAIANGTRLHFWGLPTITQEETATATIEGGSATRSNVNANKNNDSTSSRIITTPSRGMHIEMRHMLRCVHFLPDGRRVIVGGVNPQTSAEIRRQRRLADAGQQDAVPSMSFYLRLWDFDLEAARGPSTESSRQAAAARQGARITGGPAPDATERSGSGSNTQNSNQQQQSILESSRAATMAAAAANNMSGLGATRRRRAISNPRCFVPRALLYNDGGFDVSPDGKTLCACAEYWLPEGVGNATDLLHPPMDDDDDDFDDDSDYSDDSSSDGENKNRGSDKNDNDVEMDDVSGDNVDKNQTPSKQDLSIAEKATADTADSATFASVGAKETEATNEKPNEDSTDQATNSATASHTSPTRPQSSSSSLPSETPPRISGRQPQQISSPPLFLAGSVSTGLPMPPIQAGLTPQTPPPNVNPLNFPLSPPSPPGRRFAGGLSRDGSSRGTQPSSQQHEQLLQQYNRQQAMLQQHRRSQQQNMPPPQHQGVATVSTPPRRSTENGTATIPAPPGINHRSHRQQRLHAQQQSSGLQKAGNPFAASRRGANISSQRGRFVPHVVTISLDTEPYVETITEEVVVGSVGRNVVSGGEASVMATNPHPLYVDGRIRTTSVAATSNGGANATTTTITRTTYNVPGRGAAFAATRPHVLDRRPRLGQLLSACPLDVAKASAVTCVKFSPCTDFCLIGYGVREPHVEANGEGNDPPANPPFHPVTAMYKVNKGGRMRHVSTMLSGDDDVNIARFHPDSGYGFVYGTKQGRIRILGPRPWNYYNC